MIIKRCEIEMQNEVYAPQTGRFFSEICGWIHRNAYSAGVAVENNLAAAIFSFGFSQMMAAAMPASISVSLF